MLASALKLSGIFLIFVADLGASLAEARIDQELYCVIIQRIRQQESMVRVPGRNG